MSAQSVDDDAVVEVDDVDDVVVGDDPDESDDVVVEFVVVDDVEVDLLDDPPRLSFL